MDKMDKRKNFIRNVHESKKTQIVTRAVGDTIWYIDPLMTGEGLEHIKEGDCGLVQGKLSDVNVFGKAVNKEQSLWDLHITYDIGKFQYNVKADRVWSTLHQAKEIAKRMGFRVIQTWKLKDAYPKRILKKR